MLKFMLDTADCHLTFVHSLVRTFLYSLRQVRPINSPSEVLQQLGHGSGVKPGSKAANSFEPKI